MVTLHWKLLQIGLKTVLAAQMINFLQGIRHRALVIREFSSEDAAAIVADESAIAAVYRSVELRVSHHLDNDTDMESSYDLPFSNRLFILTDRASPSRRDLLALFNSPTRRAAIIDDNEWQKRLGARRPDAFIAHDSRDKASLARPLAHALNRLGLVVWFDEYSLKPGDRLSESIDRGLTDCRHAVVIVTPHLLENATWAKTEISTLLSRAVPEPNLIIPVWSGVTQESVKKRSARLADIVAIQASGDVDELATRIYVAVSAKNHGRVG